MNQNLTRAGFVTLKLGFLTILSIVSGCSEEMPGTRFPLANVQGKVVRDGKPLTNGWVEYVPVDGGKGVFRSGPIELDGMYQMTGLGPGLHVVRVVVPRDKSIFPFDQFFSPIRRTLTSDSVQTYDINLNEESKTPR